MKILVLGGGDSPERLVSLRSAKFVSESLRAAGYDVDEYDPIDGYEFLDKIDKSTIVFPILHGVGGEDGFVQQELESRGLKYLGSTSGAAKISFDKHSAKQIMAEVGIPLAAGDAVNEKSYSTHDLIKKPHVLKVRHGGSSIGTYLVHEPSEVDNREVAKVFELDQEAIVEELVIGTEITVPILGDMALPVIEIIPPNHQDFDYENKYNGKTQELCPPISISKEIQIKAQELSLKVHKSLGCRHWSRVDIIVRPDGSMVVLELNTIPGMSEQSLYPKSAQVHGLNMPDLMKKFVSLVNS